MTCVDVQSGATVAVFEQPIEGKFHVWDCLHVKCVVIWKVDLSASKRSRAQWQYSEIPANWSMKQYPCSASYGDKSYDAEAIFTVTRY